MVLFSSLYLYTRVNLASQDTEKVCTSLCSLAESRRYVNLGNWSFLPSPIVVFRIDNDGEPPPLPSSSPLLLKGNLLSCMHSMAGYSKDTHRTFIARTLLFHLMYSRRQIRSSSVVPKKKSFVHS